MDSRKHNKKNEDLLRVYTKKVEKKHIKRAVGRPERKNRPKRSAAKRTLPGEERYIITMKTDRILSMKKIAKETGQQIKDVYASAISQFIKSSEIRK